MFLFGRHHNFEVEQTISWRRNSRNDICEIKSGSSMLKISQQNKKKLYSIGVGRGGGAGGAGGGGGGSPPPQII